MTEVFVYMISKSGKNPERVRRSHWFVRDFFFSFTWIYIRLQLTITTVKETGICTYLSSMPSSSSTVNSVVPEGPKRQNVTETLHENKRNVQNGH